MVILFIRTMQSFRTWSILYQHTFFLPFLGGLYSQIRLKWTWNIENRRNKQYLNWVISETDVSFRKYDLRRFQRLFSWDFQTPLHFAVRYCQVECIRALLDAGADTTIKNVCTKKSLYFGKFWCEIICKFPFSFLQFEVWSSEFLWLDWHDSQLKVRHHQSLLSWDNSFRLHWLARKQDGDIKMPWYCWRHMRLMRRTFCIFWKNHTDICNTQSIPVRWVICVFVCKFNQSQDVKEPEML